MSVLGYAPPLLLLALGLCTTGALVGYLQPKVAMYAWIAVVSFVPVWLGVTLGTYLIPPVAVGIGVLVASAPDIRGSLMKADLLFAAILTMAVLPTLLDGSPIRIVLPLLTDTALGYLVGRTLPLRAGLDWTMNILTAVFCVVAALAVVEFVFTWNPFVQISAPNSIYATWGGLRERGGVIRAEGAFGSSIALGCSLAMAVPLAMTRAWPAYVRLLATSTLIAGTAVSFSRTGLVCALLGLVLVITVLRREFLPTRLRVWAVIAAVIGAGFAAPRIAGVFASAGDEAAHSAQYRGDLTSLISDFSVVGTSSIEHQLPDGTPMWGRFESIDSELILFGLRYGWIPLVLLLLGLATLVYVVATGRGTPPAVALTAQIPALMTVALITQYGILLAFLAGLAVSSFDPARPRQPAPATDDETEKERHEIS